MKQTLRISLILILIVVVLGMIIQYYEFIFSRRVRGQIVAIERVIDPHAVFGSRVPDSQIFSFAVAVREVKGNIVTSSSEDRQWAVAKKGMCVEAQYYPYPPWVLDKAGTYHNARMLELMDCQPEMLNSLGSSAAGAGVGAGASAESTGAQDPTTSLSPETKLDPTTDHDRQHQTQP